MKKIWGAIIAVAVVLVVVFYFIFGGGNGSSNSSAATNTDAANNSGGNTGTGGGPNSSDTGMGNMTMSSGTTMGMYKDGTYTGPVENAIYGNLQVSVTISGGMITNVTWPTYPNSPGHTSQVSASALPALAQEAIVAQSANVAIVSGATQDSQAFQQGLAAALAQAK